MSKLTVLSCIDTCPGCFNKKEIRIEVEPEKPFKREIKYVCTMCGCRRIVVFDSHSIDS